MIQAEDILAAIAGRTLWLETGARDRSNPAHRRFAAIVQRLEHSIAEINGQESAGLRRFSDLRTASGSGTYSRRAMPGAQELVAEAVANMPPIYWSAILWTIAGDGEAFRHMYRKLMDRARKSQRRDRFWPAEIARRRLESGHIPAPDYVPDLVFLAIQELRHPQLFRSDVLRANWFRISDSHWHKVVGRPYGVLQATVLVWFGEGCAHIVERLRRRAPHL